MNKDEEIIRLNRKVVRLEDAFTRQYYEIQEVGALVQAIIKNNDVIRRNYINSKEEDGE